jgi:hypothetical protein
MKLIRWVGLVTVLLGFSAAAAMADTTDPAIGVKGGGGSTGLFSLNDPNFSFTVFGSSFGVGTEQDFDFINATGSTIVEVDLLATLLAGTPALTYTCGDVSTYFTGCQVTDQGGGQTLIRYFGPASGTGGTFAGIPNAPDISCDGIHSCFTGTPGADFAISVIDVNGDLANLAAGQGFSVQGTLVAPVPEPASIVLISTGLASLGLFKRRRSKKSNASNSLS